MASYKKKLQSKDNEYFCHPERGEGCLFSQSYEILRSVRSLRMTGKETFAEVAPGREKSGRQLVTSLMPTEQSKVANAQVRLYPGPVAGERQL
jgi:hypothetical protein